MLLFLALLLTQTFGKDPDETRSFKEIAEANGFPYEEHIVLTEDGYLLTQFRIPSDGPPIFFQHGFMDSADCWVMNYADIAPAFVAARQGYDVWLGNSRGNRYSEKHVSLDPFWDRKEFWNFDWTEMGLYDLPASFDYITELTGYPKLAYIGHSQGTTQMFYGLAHNEAYFAEKVNLFVALAPVTKISHTESILGWISQVYDEFEDAVEFL